MEQTLDTTRPPLNKSTPAHRDSQPGLSILPLLHRRAANADDAAALDKKRLDHGTQTRRTLRNRQVQRIRMREALVAVAVEYRQKAK